MSKYLPGRHRELQNPEGPGSEVCRAEDAFREAFGASLTKTMDDLKLDAFAYPTWSNPPRLIGDLTSPAGDNSQWTLGGETLAK